MNTLREAAQQALEALEYAHKDGFWREQSNAIAALKAALEQPEQDEAPAAWMFQHEETGRMNYVSNDGYDATGRFLEMNPRYALVCALYTYPPPRREWRGLTDEVIADLWHQNGGFHHHFARAVERWLRGKDHA